MQNVHLLGNTEHIQIVFLKIIVINSDLFWYGAVSSVGRASRLHRGGQRFESFTAHQNSGGVAQLVRARACHARGRGFESLHSRHSSLIC